MENEEGRLKNLSDLATARAEKLKKEFEMKVNSIKDKIRELQNQKLGILKGRISKQEAVQLMVGDLKNGRQTWIMEKFIIPNLRTYQSQYRSLKDLNHLKVHQLANSEWISFIYNWISDEMIIEASKALEDGPTEKERRSKIEGFDREIEKLARELENILE